MSDCNLLQKLEQNEKLKSTAYLKQLLAQYGVPVSVYRSEKTRQSSVYGTQAGETETKFHTITALVIGDDYFAYDNFSAGTFEQGFLYTLDTDIRSGDTVAIDRTDGRSRRYKVNNAQTFGTTTSILSRFELSALGE